MGEFELIERHFRRPQDHRRGAVALGAGDDCALLQPTPGCQWAVSTDTLVEGRHFLPTVDPARLGHKALAVNLSDLAACGAEPRAFFLALTLPRVDEAWLSGFAAGLYALADAHGIVLAGGDTTAGPLAIGITVMGEVPAGQALRRDGACAGDALWVSHPISGGVGDARLALEVFRGTVSLPGVEFDTVRLRMERPEPRVALGLALRGIARAAIDISDGLLGDLGHVLRASGVGATVDVDALPRSAVLGSQPLALQRLCTLAGGDDYELLFSTPPEREGEVRAAAAQAGLAVRRIGRLEAEPGLRLVDASGAPVAFDVRSFDHFAEGAPA